MRCLLERCPPYEVSVREVSAMRYEVSAIRCQLERCPPYEVSVREVSAI